MSTDGGDATHLSIGEVLSFIQEEFPDVTISKIRFLESQGLIQPDRTASGYRKFYESDIERLQWILRQQRDHFLPLKVIRKMLDEGVDQFDPGGGAQPTLWTPTGEDESGSEPEPAAVGTGPPRSSAHPAVASAPRAAPKATPRDTPKETATRPAASPGNGSAVAHEVPLEPTRAVTPGVEPGVASGGGVAARTSADQPAAQAGNTGGTGGTASQPSAPSGSGRREPAPVDGAASGRPSGASSGSGRGSRRRGPDGPSEPPAAPPPGTGSAGPEPRPTHETPADVVAALQEDPRTRTRGRGPAGGPSDRSGTSGRGRPPEPPPPVDPDTQVTASELCEATGIDGTLLDGLEQFGLVVGQPQGGEQVYGAEALQVARLAARYAEHGVEPRHLRMYLVSAEREAGFVEQLAVPFLKQRNPQARSQARDLTEELTSMGAELHAALLRRELGPDLRP